MRRLLSSIVSDSIAAQWKHEIPYHPQEVYKFLEGETDTPQWSPPFHRHDTDSPYSLEWKINRLTLNDLEFLAQQHTLIIKGKSVALNFLEPPTQKKGRSSFFLKHSATKIRPVPEGESPLSVWQTDHLLSQNLPTVGQPIEIHLDFSHPNLIHQKRNCSL